MKLGNMGNMGRMMKQVQKMQEELAALQEQVAKQTVQATAGGGAVTAVCNGAQELVSLSIEAEALDPDDRQLVEEMVVEAVNEALRLSREMMEEEMKRITGGLNLPGLPGF